MTLWHNPRCSKSREALALLEQRGVAVSIRRYLDDPPTLAELQDARQRLGVATIAMMRSKDAAFREQGLTPATDDDTLLTAMARDPRLIERPIAFSDNGAAIGRPPERVLDIL